MSHRFARFVALTLTLSAACALAVGCAGNAGDDDGADDPCPAWRTAVCAYHSRCTTGFSREDCAAQAAMIECNSEETAQACVTTLNDESEQCMSYPTACDMAAVADRESARAKCESLLSVICEQRMACGVYANESECRTQVTADLNCAQVIGVAKTYDDCTRSFKSLPCGGGTPQVCINVFVEE